MTDGTGSFEFNLPRWDCRIFAVTSNNEDGASTARLWTSANGKFTVRASLIRADGDQVCLKREDNGQAIAVRIELLSEQDQAFVPRQP